MRFQIFKLITGILVLGVLVVPSQLVAQAQQHYKFIDLGTLGGPHSYGSVNGEGFSLLNNSGVVASSADLAVADPNETLICFDPDCFQAHAFRWKDGVMTDLGALPGNNNSAAASINARGWITGQSQISIIDPVVGLPEFRGVLWKDGQVIDLGTLPGGNESLGIYVNDSGQVVGFSDNGVPDPFSLFPPFSVSQIHTFLWENGAMRDIGTLGGPDAVPTASCSGQPHDVIVGYSYTSTTPNASTGIPTLDPFLWKKGVMSDLGSLGGTFGFAQCTNNRGQIIGLSNLAGDIQNHAFFWENGVMTDLGTLGGDFSEAIWLNDAGIVVGSADLPGSPGNQTHDAVVWMQGKIHDLGTISGDACSRGRGLNARGQVVGGSSDCSNFLHAFLWEEGGPMLDLNTLIAPGSGFQLTNAFNINDRGEILAKAAPLGFTPNDDEDLGHVVLLVPCDPDTENCAAILQNATVITSHPAAPIIKNSPSLATRQTALTPRANLAAWRARLARRYRFPAMVTP